MAGILRALQVYRNSHNPPTCLPVSGGRGIPVLKQIGKLITEPLSKGDKSRPLRWRMGMRLNHIHNDLHSKHPKLWNAIVMTARSLICKPFGHRWTRFEAVKYGDFGDSRICKLCRISHGQHRGVDTYHETHRQGGWNKIAKP